jgi:acylpyruvate hydrolase
LMYVEVQIQREMAAYLGNKLVQMGTKIVGVGRNYAAHAKELGNALPSEPLLFLKPTSSYIREGMAIEIPHPCTALDHEVELGVVIGKKGRDIPQHAAMDHISGYALALDMTARELQAVAKQKGLPWTLAKGYDTFTPIGNFIPKTKVPSCDDLELWLEVDGKLRQKGNTKDMIFSIPVLISYISSIMTLNEGDVILTGIYSHQISFVQIAFRRKGKLSHGANALVKISKILWDSISNVHLWLLR